VLSGLKVTGYLLNQLLTDIRRIKNDGNPKQTRMGLSYLHGWVLWINVDI